jgi:nucleotide-binding universal stress UspA family protein
MVVMLVNDLATSVILERAEDADLVVLGSRGHGGFVGLLLGSVSNQVVHHADCPVVAVRPTKRRAAGVASQP